MFLNVSFENKVNNTGKELLCCEYTICNSRIKNTQSYIQRISDISPNNGIHCLDCGITQIEKNKFLAMKHINTIQVILEYARNNKKRDFLSLPNTISIPKVGDVVYIPTTDTLNGGRTIISEVEIGISGGEDVILITTEVNPDIVFNWEWLKDKQEQHKNNYGNREASIYDI